MGKKTNNRTNNMFNDDSILNGEFPIKNFKAYKSFYNRILKRILDMVFVSISYYLACLYHNKYSYSVRNGTPCSISSRERWI